MSAILNWGDLLLRLVLALAAGSLIGANRWARKAGLIAHDRTCLSCSVDCDASEMVNRARNLPIGRVLMKW
jgi:uncharacterized membrane protein YhiD involved in acid resistance